MATVHSENQNPSPNSSSQRERMRRSNGNGNGNRRPLQPRDTGYRLGGGSRRQSASRNINPRIIVVGVVGLLLLISLLFAVSSCVKGCSGDPQPKEEQNQEEKVNPDDSRVAYGVPSDQTAKLSAVLDRNEAFAKIAERADKYTDTRMIDLAIAEPEAISFIAGFPDSDGSTKPFDGQVTRGEYPKLYTFDARWGYAIYADGIMGITGSGPVSLSMASMGLSGKATYEPNTVAQAVSAANAATGSTGMDDSFLTSHASDAGVVATLVEGIAEGGIFTAASEGAPVIVKLKSSCPIGNGSAHWVLVTGTNQDGTLNIADPTSAVASSHPWSASTIATSADSAYALAAAAGTTGVSQDGTNPDGTTLEGTNPDGTPLESAEPTGLGVEEEESYV